MRQLFVFALVFLFGAAPLMAQETDLVALETGEASRGWEGVGRLDMGGVGFCTATLIQERLILTAAHCVFDQNGKLREPEMFTFNAGLRGGRAVTTRGIKRFVAHPDYSYGNGRTRLDDVAMDIAVLELDRPIRLPNVQPFGITEDPQPGDQIGVISYGRGRANAASLQEVCNVIDRQGGMVVMNCDVEPGSSGSPAFTLIDGKPRIVSVISAMSMLGTQQVALGTSLNEPLKRLMRHFESVGPAKPGGNQQLIQMGQRNDTGAKFVRP